MNVELIQVGINGVQGFVECKRHYPIGVPRTLSGCLEMGEGSLSYTLFILVYVLCRHIGNSPVSFL